MQLSLSEVYEKVQHTFIFIYLYLNYTLHFSKVDSPVILLHPVKTIGPVSKKPVKSGKKENYYMWNIILLYIYIYYIYYYR